MQFNRKTYTIHGGLKRHILSPVNCYHNIVAGHNNKVFEVIISNGSGYKILNELFVIASRLEENEIIYLSTVLGIEDYKKTFEVFDFYEGIYLTNYCSTQMSIKGISKLRDIKTYNEITITRNAIDSEKIIENWKVSNRLTIKNYKKDLYISTNRNGFQDLANGSRRMSSFGDDTECNDYSPHCHFDWKENTSKSSGITLEYGHNP